jgi:hypothetical protein
VGGGRTSQGTACTDTGGTNGDYETGRLLWGAAGHGSIVPLAQRVQGRRFILWSSCHPKVDLRVRKLMLREAGDSPKVT